MANRTECFKKQYSDYSLPETGDYVSMFFEFISLAKALVFILID